MLLHCNAFDVRSSLQYEVFISFVLLFVCTVINNNYYFIIIILFINIIFGNINLPFTGCSYILQFLAIVLASGGSNKCGAVGLYSTRGLLR